MSRPRRETPLADADDIVRGVRGLPEVLERVGRNYRCYHHPSAVDFWPSPSR